MSSQVSRPLALADTDEPLKDNFDNINIEETPASSVKQSNQKDSSDPNMAAAINELENINLDDASLKHHSKSQQQEEVTDSKSNMPAVLQRRRLETQMRHADESKISMATMS